MKSLITPEKAEKLLEKNSHNRKISNRIVNRIAKKMEDNKWAYNGEGIIIAENGDLLDGQHRLLGVIKSGKDVHMELITEVPNICEYTGIEVFSTIDTGRNRSPDDVIFVKTGNSNSKLASVFVKLINAVNTKSLKTSLSSQNSNEDILDWYLQYQETIENLIEDSKEMRKHSIYSYMKERDFATMIYGLRKEPSEQRDTFLLYLAKFDPELMKDGKECGENKKELCTILKTLYEKLSFIAEEVGTGAAFTRLKYVGMFKAYEYWKTGETTQMAISQKMDIIYPDSL